MYHLSKNGADVYDDDGNRTFTEVSEQKSLKTPCCMMLMGSFSKFVMVFNDVRLVWAAKSMTAPVFIDTCTFRD